MWTTHLFVVLVLLEGVQVTQGVMQLYATETEATFNSVNYPSAYPIAIVEEWLITTNDTAQVIFLDVLAADIEENTESNDCSYDYVSVYDGINAGQDILGSFCGTNKPSFTSTSNNIYVYFYSDYSVPKTGFQIKYRAGSPVTEVNWRWIIGGIFIALAVIGIVVGFVIFAFWNSPKSLQTIPDRGTLYEAPLRYKDPRKAPPVKVVVTTEDEVHDLKDLPDGDVVEETPVEPIVSEKEESTPPDDNATAAESTEKKSGTPATESGHAPSPSHAPDHAHKEVASPRRVSVATPPVSVIPPSEVELPEVVLTPPEKESSKPVTFKIP